MGGYSMKMSLKKGAFAVLDAQFAQAKVKQEIYNTATIYFTAPACVDDMQKVRIMSLLSYIENFLNCDPSQIEVVSDYTCVNQAFLHRFGDVYFSSYHAVIDLLRYLYLVGDDALLWLLRGSYDPVVMKSFASLHNAEFKDFSADISLVSLNRNLMLNQHELNSLSYVVDDGLMQFFWEDEIKEFFDFRESIVHDLCKVLFTNAEKLGLNKTVLSALFKHWMNVFSFAEGLSVFVPEGTPNISQLMEVPSKTVH